MPTVAVAVSGGVDSLAALLLLRREFSRVVAVHGIFHDGARAPSGLAEICRDLSVPFHVVDLRNIFQSRVIACFIKSHEMGLTPNPCAICNREIKFGALRDFCRRLGATRMATGHYARLGTSEQGCCLYAGSDGRKDQSYFLSLVSRDALACALFPLARYAKAQVRELVAAAGYEPPVAAESQDICFLPDGGKGAFLRRFLHSEPGIISLAHSGRELGRHCGLCHYTVGQRRGLGIAWREPLYVRETDWQKNVLVVAPRSGVLMGGCTVRQVNVLAAGMGGLCEADVKLRYSQEPAPATVRRQGERLHLRLETPILATAPGQVAAIYADDGRVLAGGIVERVEFCK